jgi:hypothetical protein
LKREEWNLARLTGHREDAGGGGGRVRFQIRWLPEENQEQ